jgi:CheY-like chemotaxis protein
MTIVNAESGQAGIDLLKSSQDVDLVMMDIMVPHMDGYWAIKHIRRLKTFKDLPIIALTAKAMPEDRGRCFRLHLKPFDAPQLISLMRVWLYK